MNIWHSGGPVGLHPTLLACAVALALPPLMADEHDENPEFEEAHIFFELNHTDGDLGIHGLIDGDPWHRLIIRDPRNRTLMHLRAQRKLRHQGLTELFFESAEPTFDELDPVDFFARFRPGMYRIIGSTLDGERLRSLAHLTQVMPAPALVTVNGMAMAEDCDEDDPEEDDPTIVIPPVTISWEPVTLSHPDADGAGAAVQPPVAVEIVNYQLVVEVEDAEFSLILPPEVTSVELPAALTDLGERFKYEVLAREVSDNQTAVESCFAFED